MKLRAAVKKGKAIEKLRADLEAQLAAVREQVPHPSSTQGLPLQHVVALLSTELCMPVVPCRHWPGGLKLRSSCTKTCSTSGMF